MLSDGELVRLTASDFDELIKQTLLSAVRLGIERQIESVNEDSGDADTSTQQKLDELSREAEARDVARIEAAMIVGDPAPSDWACSEFPNSV